MRETLRGGFSNRVGGDGGEDEIADYVLPVFVPSLGFVFHGGEMRGYEGEFEG